MTIANLAVLCVDVGSVGAAHFAWWGGVLGEEGSGRDPATLAQAVALHLRALRPVALGFGCPLSVPLAKDQPDFTAGPWGGEPRPWSATAGAAELTTGLTQVLWVLHHIREKAHAPAFLKWADFQHSKTGLFIWEAVVTGGPAEADPEEKARRGVRAFRAALPDPTSHSRIAVMETFSLVGAALLRTGWKTNPAVLGTAALVIRGSEQDVTVP